MTTTKERPPVTTRQRAAYHALAELIEENGQPPTLAELAEKMGSPSRNPAYQLLWALYEKGYVTWETGTPRSFRILRKLPPPKK